MNEQDSQEDMKDEFKEREEDYNRAERQRKKGLRTQPKPGEPGYATQSVEENKSIPGKNE
jgi:hypothetical protein